MCDPRASLALTAGFALSLAAGPASAQTGVNPAKDDLPEAQKIYSPYVERTATDRSFAEGLYWGDTHLHTRYSTDAGMIGNKLGPEEAYRFALGEEVLTSSGQRARLIRPLDVLVVPDHAENLGLAPMIVETSVQARFLVPMAVSLGFGVLAATMIMLLIVPCSYLILEDARRGASNVFSRLRGRPTMPPPPPTVPSDVDVELLTAE